MQVEERINLNHSIWVAELKHLTFLCLVDSLGYVSSKFLIFRLFCLLLENLSYRHAMLNLSYFCFYRRVKQLWQQKKSRQVLGPQELIPLTRTWRQSRAVRQARWAVLSLWAHPWEAKHGGLKKPLTDLHWGLSRMFSLNAIHIYLFNQFLNHRIDFLPQNQVDLPQFSFIDSVSSLAFSKDVSISAYSFLAAQYLSMSWHFSSIWAASVSASCFSCLTYSRLPTDWTSLNVNKRPTNKLMTGRYTTVSHRRLWKVNCELWPLGSSNITTSLSFPRIRPKPSSTEDGSPSMALTHHGCPVTMAPPATANPTFHLEPNQQPASWNGQYLGEVGVTGRFVNKMWFCYFLMVIFFTSFLQCLY